MRKNWKLYLAVFTLLIAGGYVYLWTLGADRLEMMVVKHFEDLEASGYAVEYDSIHVRGFPFEIKLHLENPSIEVLGEDGYAVSVVGLLTGKAFFWAPTKATFNTKGKVVIKSATLKKPMVVEEGQALVDLDRPFQEFDVRLGRLKDAKTLIKNLQLVGKTTREDERSYRVHINDFKLFGSGFDKPPFEIEKMNLTVTFDQGFKWVGNLKHTLENAREVGALCKITQAEVHCGDFKAKTNGHLRFDNSLQPEVTLSSEIIGLDNVIDGLRTKGYLNQQFATAIQQGIQMLERSRQVNGHTENYHAFVIEVKEGTVFLGPIPLMKLPVISWDQG